MIMIVLVVVINQAAKEYHRARCMRHHLSQHNRTSPPVRLIADQSYEETACAAEIPATSFGVPQSYIYGHVTAAHIAGAAPRSLS